MQTGRVAAVIVAAGRGSRASSDRGVKQYVGIGGESVLARAVRAFTDHPLVGRVQVVIHADDAALYGAAVAGLDAAKLAPPVVGGATRQASVRRGLDALLEGPIEALRDGTAVGIDRVLIHDAARPFVASAEIDGVIAALAKAPGAILAVPVVDTLKRQAEGGGNTIAQTVPRAGLWRAQTPQGFHFATILAAHTLAAESGRDDFTDDASIAEAAGIPVVLVPGAERNFKITDLGDLARAEREVADMGQASEQRTGTGFDVHAFSDGDHVVLCGVAIPHGQALSGHSDADVAMHALTDALYGAIANGDIGHHFPPSDPKWKGAASRIFLEHARDRVAALGGRIVNVDVTIICEAPKVGPHREAMRARLAEILAIDIGRVGVKATTTERLGFTGRREGIAAMASATVAIG